MCVTLAKLHTRRQLFFDPQELKKLRKLLGLILVDIG